MTHDETYQIDNFDELLERVSDYISSECDCESCQYINGPYKALRAVVELCAKRDFVTIGDKSIFNSGRNSVKEEIIQAIEEQIK